MLILTLSVSITMVLSSPQTKEHPKIITSYSSVIKDSSSSLDATQTSLTPREKPPQPKNINLHPADNSVNGENSLKITTEVAADDLSPNTNVVKKAVDLSWLDLSNVSKKGDHYNSTVKAIEYLRELNSSANQRTKNISKEEPYFCTETFGDKEFFIRSPNYPFNYPAYTNCKFTVNRLSKTICGIIFTVLRFDVDPTESNAAASDAGTCPGDKLLIGNELICGRMRRGTESFTRFTSSTFNLTFLSGNGFGSSGFLIKGKQTPYCLPEKPLAPPLLSSVSCNSIITEDEFNITSPLFPASYPDDLECHYEVLQSNWNICGLQLTPSYFDVEGASYCMFDYVEIQGKRLCGNLTPKEEFYYMFETDRIDIRFRTDESVSKGGFNIKGKQILCTELEYFQPIHSPLAAADTIRESKANDDLHNYQDIGNILSLLVKSGTPSESAEISARDAKSIGVSANSLAEEVPLPLISGNNVSKFNAFDEEFLAAVSNNASDVLKTSRTRKTNNFVQKESEEPFSPPVYFPIPSKYTRGSSASKDLFPSGACDERHSERVFIIQSVNYPNNYPNDLNCVYYIYRSSPNVCQLRLTLEDINVEKKSSPPEDCGDDYLDIAGYKLCGSFKKTVLNIAFTGENVIIRFVSNSQNSGTGFLITVEQIDTDCESRGRKVQDLACDSVIRHENFTIFSPGYPHWYPRDMWCTTTVYKTSPSIRSLEVIFQEFDLEWSPQCENDFLSIGNRRFCGQKSGNSYIVPFEDDSIQLTFATNEDISSNGFRIFMKQIPDAISTQTSRSPQCGGEYHSSVNVLTSPQYPTDYEGDLHCVYSIFRSSQDICQLQIKIIDFDVEPSPGCRRDYLQLGLRRLCGQNYVNEIHNYHFSSEKFNIMFHSDAQNSGKGFRIEVTQRSCLNSPGTDSNIQTPPSIITAPPHSGRPDFGNELEFPTLVSPSQTYFPINPTPSSQSGGRFPIKFDPNCMKNFRVVDSTQHKQQTRPRTYKYPWPSSCPWCNKLYPYYYNYGNNYYNSHGRVPFPAEYLKPNQIQAQSSNQVSTTQNNRGSVSSSNIPGVYYTYNAWQSQPLVHRVNFGRSFLTSNRTLGNIPRDLPFPNDSAARESSNKILNFLRLNNFSRDSNPEELKSHFSLSDDQLQHQDHSQNLSSQTFLLSNGIPIKPPTARAAFSGGSGSHLLLPVTFSSSTVDNSSKNGPSMIVRQLPPISKGNSDEGHLLKLQNETPDFKLSEHLCNKSISRVAFEMKSPGYPGPFYTNMNCYYRIYRNDVSYCGLLVNIEMLDLPGSPPCLESYLSIAGRRFCGSMENGITVVVPFSTSSPITIEYRSDTFHSGAGFSLKARQIRCNFTQSSGRHVFNSKNFDSFFDAIPSQSQTLESFLRPQDIPQDIKFVGDNVGSSSPYSFLYYSNQEGSSHNSGFRPSQPVGRESLSVPWAGARAAKNPPYNTGLDLVRIAKG